MILEANEATSTGNTRNG